MFLMKALTTRKKVIFPKLFFVNYGRAGTRISLHYFIWLKSKPVKIYSVVKKGFKYIKVKAGYANA